MSGGGETIYAASSNAGKLRDFAAAAAVFGVAIAVLPGLSEIAPPPEDGATFEANAREKALAYSHVRPGLLVLADDSGLEVDALDGEPGVRSARYAEDAGFAGDASDSSDGQNNACLLERLKASGAPEPWAARYRCALALARDGVVLRTAEGAVEGEIVIEPRGTGGFGYDPLFWLPELGLTMAEIDLETKQTLSHRGRALRALLERMAESPVGRAV
ncbi:MAG: Nucleoside 5-triphosphatase RdgB (dHAPTP, dITP, XTP-specific) [Acidobacteriaceae bacterium]|nr:Nucleoside 5-triphosphatase RdgB (dHAPTP, dITP, XTP-specific) [Acidobacteriaceae bacterium]